jgi:hypothetical protein
MGSILNQILRPIQRFPQRLKSVGISHGHSGQTLRFRTCASGTLVGGGIRRGSILAPKIRLGWLRRTLYGSSVRDDREPG